MGIVLEDFRIEGLKVLCIEANQSTDALRPINLQMLGFLMLGFFKDNAVTC
jgi:hypothetical protein